MRDTFRFSSAALAALLGLGTMTGLGCEQASEDDASEQASEQELKAQRAVLAACNLDDGTVEMHAKVHACDPMDKKKTTICHVPPGNPANAHTLCIGNAAVKHHLANHPDYLGPCKVETPCPPPPVPGTGGASGGLPGVDGGGAGGAGGAGAGGAGGAGGLVLPPDGTGGATGGSPPPITID